MEDCPTCGLNAAVSAGSFYDEEELLSKDSHWAGTELYDGRSFLHQFESLRSRFANLSYDMSRWKVLTIAGGGHPFLTLDEDDILDKVEEGLHELLTRASSFAPVYINLLESWTDIDQTHQDNFHCKLLAKVLVPLQSGISFDFMARRFESLATSYNKLLKTMQHRFDDPEGGVIVRVQPTVRRMVASKETLDKLSCYHPSRLQHSLMARTLLQNMIECDESKKWDRPSLANSSVTVIPQERELC